MSPVIRRPWVCHDHRNDLGAPCLSEGPAVFHYTPCSLPVVLNILGS